MSDVIAPRLAHLWRLPFTEWTLVALAAALAVWAAGRWLRDAVVYETLLAGVSVAVVAWLVTPLLALVALAWIVALHAAVERCPPSLSRVVVTVLLGTMVVVPVWQIGALGTRGWHVREFVGFATNMALLRAWGWAHDRWRGASGPEPLRRLILAMLFFPTLPNGPVEVPRQLPAAWTPAPVAAVLPGLGRVLVGVAKLTVVALLFPADWIEPFGAAAEDGGMLVLWSWAIRFWIWFYLSFSAWSDVAIGLGLLCGHRVVENFDAPWLAVEPADFWHRWHLSFGRWLRDHVYIPLGGNRRHHTANVVAVFVVSALWHVWGSLKLLGFGYYPVRAWWGFLAWGLLNAAGVLVARSIAAAIADGGRPAVVAGRVGTFLFSALCWMPFFIPGGIDVATGVAMLGRMLWPQNP